MENEKYTPSEKNGKWGCADNKGNVIVPLRCSMRGMSFTTRQKAFG